MSTLRTQYENYLFVNQDSKLTFEEWEQRVFTPTIQNGIKQIMERDTSWDDPQLSNGDMPIRQQNTLKNTLPEVVEKWDKILNISDKTNIAELMESEASKLLKEEFNQLDELNDYLRMLADMDKIGIRRKIVLLEGYIHMLKSKTK